MDSQWTNKNPQLKGQCRQKRKNRLNQNRPQIPKRKSQSLFWLSSPSQLNRLVVRTKPAKQKASKCLANNYKANL